jgi:hypothetical protein
MLKKTGGFLTELQNDLMANRGHEAAVDKMKNNSSSIYRVRRKGQTLARYAALGPPNPD